MFKLIEPSKQLLPGYKWQVLSCLENLCKALIH